MDTEVVKIAKLTASEGCYLTQNPQPSIEKVIVCQSVYLAKGTLPEAWKEISAEEAEKLTRLKEEYFKKREQEAEANLNPHQNLPTGDTTPTN